MRVLGIRTTLAILLSMGLLFAGCGGDSSEDESDDGAAGDTVGAEIAEDFNRSMDKARDIEEKLQDSKDAMDAAVEEAEGGVKDE